MFRKSVFFLAILSLLIFLTGSAGAETFSFYVSRDGEYTPDAIALTYVSGNYYLFLPGQSSLDCLFIGFTGTKENVFLNGRQISKGDPASILHNENEIQVGYRRIRFNVMQGSPELPVLYITTKTGSLDKIEANKKYKESSYLIMTDGSGNVIYDADLVYMKMRGNATTKYTKKNYQIKLENGTNLLGMGKAKKWILTGAWIDKSFIRNQMSFDLAEYIGIPYTPQHHQTELYVNHEYRGLYLFSEKVEINKHRIEINDLEKNTEILSGDLSLCRRLFRKLSNGASVKAFDIPILPDDNSGGYLIEYEKLKSRYDPELSGFTTKREFMFVLKSPEYASLSQVTYIAEIMQGFENAIFSEDGIDPVTGKHYYEFVDKDSLVRKYIFNEFIKNYDGNNSSEYFYKPEDSVSDLVYAGPVWDLDNCYANYARDYNKNRILGAEGFFVSGESKSDNWWPNLYRIPDFYEAVVRCFDGIFRDAVDIILGSGNDPSGILRSLDEYASSIEKSAEMTYVRYPALRNLEYNVQTGRNLQENIEYLRTFISGRMAFLDREWIENDDENNLLQFLVR